MEKQRVLFVCIHNSARSQMAEAWMNHLCGDRYEAQSAGLEPGALNPLAVAVMKEVGIDISGKTTRSVFDVYKSGALFSYVITVCDESAAEACPIFPGPTRAHSHGLHRPLEVGGAGAGEAGASTGDPGLHPQGRRGVLPAGTPLG